MPGRAPNYSGSDGVSDEVALLKRLSLRIALPIVAGVLFAMLCFLTTRQLGIIELGGWGSSSKDAIALGTEPVDIGTRCFAPRLQLARPHRLISAVAFDLLD